MKKLINEINAMFPTVHRSTSPTHDDSAYQACTCPRCTAMKNMGFREIPTGRPISFPTTEEDPREFPVPDESGDFIIEMPTGYDQIFCRRDGRLILLSHTSESITHSGKPDGEWEPCSEYKEWGLYFEDGYQCDFDDDYQCE